MKILVTIVLCATGLLAHSQQGNSDVQKGNDAYRKSDYKAAADAYTKALGKEPGNNAAKFNLGNSLLKQKNNEGAAKQYDDIITTAKDTAILANALYNRGLAQLRQQNLDAAIQSFKQALALAPADNDIRENLQKALNEQRQKQQEQQPKKQQQKQDKPKQQQQKPMNKQMMEQKFNELRNQEKQLQQQLQRKPQDNQPEKDW